MGKFSKRDSFQRKIKTKLWIWDGPSPWYFITVPKSESMEIKKIFGAYHRGWGSIPVSVRIGASNWKTSIFWEKKGTYLLPIKKEIRKTEDIKNGDLISLTLLIENVI